MTPVQAPTTHTTLFAVRHDGRPDQVSVRCEAINWRVSATIVEVKIDCEVQLVEVETKADRRERHVLAWDSVFPEPPTLERLIDAAECLARGRWSAVHSQSKVTP